MWIYGIVMSFHIWRKIYYVFGWEYPEKADERQKHLKHCLCNQIKNTKDIQKILRENGEIKEQDFEHNIDELPTFEHSLNHYTQAITRPDTPCPNNLILDNDGVIIDTPTGYTRLDNNNNNNNNNKRKSRTKKRKRNKF